MSDSVLDRDKTADVFTSAPQFFDVLLSLLDVLY